MGNTILMERHASDRGYVLVPADARAIAVLAKMEPGELVEITVRRGRSLRHHRLFWSVLQHVSKATEWEYPERLLVALKVRLGRYDLLQLPNGKLAPVPHSISFSEMSQDDFQTFFNQCLGLICAEVLPGYNPEVLIADTEKAQ